VGDRGFRLERARLCHERSGRSSTGSIRGKSCITDSLRSPCLRPSSSSASFG
jgi:hypothetical protein